MKTFLKHLLFFIVTAATFGLFALYLLESAENIMAGQDAGIRPVAAAPFAKGGQSAAAEYEHIAAKSLRATSRPPAQETPRPAGAFLLSPASAASGPKAPPAGQWRVVERAQSYNKELQYYSPDNVLIQAGGVTVSSRREARGEKSYTSGMVESDACFLFGSFSFTVRIPEGKGLFPAIWLMPVADKPFPEIDIFEMIGSEPHRFYGVLHYMEGESQRRAYFSERVEPKESYVIGLLWTPEELSWYIDGACVFTFDKAIPDEPMYLIINQAVGGVWPGSPNEATDFPADFVVEAIEIDADWSGAR